MGADAAAPLDRELGGTAPAAVAEVAPDTGRGAEAARPAWPCGGGAGRVAIQGRQRRRRRGGWTLRRPLAGEDTRRQRRIGHAAPQVDHGVAGDHEDRRREQEPYEADLRDDRERGERDRGPDVEVAPEAGADGQLHDLQGDHVDDEERDRGRRLVLARERQQPDREGADEAAELGDHLGGAHERRHRDRSRVRGNLGPLDSLEADVDGAADGRGRCELDPQEGAEGPVDDREQRHRVGAQGRRELGGQPGAQRTTVPNDRKGPERSRIRPTTKPIVSKMPTTPATTSDAIESRNARQPVPGDGADPLEDADDERPGALGQRGKVGVELGAEIGQL